MTEAQLLTWLIGYAHQRGWMASHALPALTRGGRWHTATMGDVGAPDLLLARGGSVLHVETKSDKGRLGPGQADWADAIGATHRLWRPAHLQDGTIQAALR